MKKEMETMSANVETMFYVRVAPWHGLGTVSYTHLDVYKRQFTFIEFNITIVKELTVNCFVCGS